MLSIIIKECIVLPLNPSDEKIYFICQEIGYTEVMANYKT